MGYTKHGSSQALHERPSQAVRLPRERRFEGTEVRIYREGDRVILEPIRRNLRQQLRQQLLEKHEREQHEHKHELKHEQHEHKHEQAASGGEARVGRLRVAQHGLAALPDDLDLIADVLQQLTVGPVEVG